MKYFEELKQAVIRENLYETSKVLEKIKSEEQPFEYIEPLFKFMEEHQNIDYGSPGPLVDFIENCDGYEKKLIESVERFPIMQTIWMINGVINGSAPDTKKMYIDILTSIIDRNDVSSESKELAQQFITFQNNRVNRK